METGKIEYSPDYESNRNTGISGTGIRAKTPKDDEISKAFLSLWDKAVSQEGYEKSEWQSLRHLLRSRGIVI